MNEKKNIKLVQLGERIREMRINKDLTQLELADRSGCASNYIAMLERGERNPTYLTLLKIAGGLGVKMGELVKE